MVWQNLYYLSGIIQFHIFSRVDHFPIYISTIFPFLGWIIFWEGSFSVLPYKLHLNSRVYKRKIFNDIRPIEEGKISYIVPTHNVHFSKCYVTVRPACLAESQANTTWILFLLPSISAEASWLELFVLVSHDDSKYHQVLSITISSCHSLPFFDTFYWKNGLNFS